MFIFIMVAFCHEDFCLGRLFLVSFLSEGKFPGGFFRVTFFRVPYSQDPIMNPVFLRRFVLFIILVHSFTHIIVILSRVHLCITLISATFMTLTVLFTKSRFIHRILYVITVIFTANVNTMHGLTVKSRTIHYLKKTINTKQTVYK